MFENSLPQKPLHFATMNLKHFQTCTYLILTTFLKIYNIKMDANLIMINTHLYSDISIILFLPLSLSFDRVWFLN